MQIPPFSRFSRAAFLSACAGLLLGFAAPAQADTVRLFLIGNSFSGNATRYLPQLAKEGKHTLIIGRAEVGSCSLERHWNAYVAAERDPNSAAGKFYKGKTLRQLLGTGTWDIVTIQQYSLLSPDVRTYQPFARNLHDAIRTLQPKAEVVLHQTWAYRTDANSFGYINLASQKRARTQGQMWAFSHLAYNTIARERGLRVIPSGDAFWRVDSDPLWGYKRDTAFNFKNPVYPTLPDQRHSLQVGYSWSSDKNLKADFNHASDAGCYLLGLVWYGFLFHESPETLRFTPKGIPPDFAAHLRSVATQILREDSLEKAF